MIVLGVYFVARTRGAAVAPPFRAVFDGVIAGIPGQWRLEPDCPQSGDGECGLMLRIGPQSAGNETRRNAL